MKTITILLFLISNFAFAQNSRNENRFSSPYQNDYQRVTGGENHTLEIRNGQLWSCGRNNQGQLGNGNNVNQSSPVQVGSNDNWVLVSAGRNYSIGIRADGTLWAWGVNNVGQLGDGTLTSRNAPVQIGTDNSWVSISVGQEHSVALKSNGTLWAWGGNTGGRLGNGTTTNQSSPIQIGTDSNWKSITAGYSNTLAIKSDGTLWAWGFNANGVVGNGTTTNALSPVQVGSDNKWLKVTSKNQVLALKTNGELWAWGLNNAGQIGDGTTTTRLSPVLIGSAYTHIQTGGSYSMALKEGKLYAWGSNSIGQFGNGTNTNSTTPLQITSNTNYVYIESGWNSSYCLKASGELMTTGDNTYGQLGLGNTTNLNTLTQTSIIVDGWLMISAGTYYMTGIKFDGTLWAWGNNGSGQLGDGTTTNSSVPIQVGTDNTWVAIHSAESKSIGLKADGTLWNVGASNTQITSPNKRWRSLGVGLSHYLAIATDGTLWTWGANPNGQLGNGNTTSTTTLGQIGSLNNWTSVRGGWYHSLLLRSDGTIWTAGGNQNGQLGNGTTTSSSVLVQAGTSTTNSAIDASTFNCYAIRSNGTLYGWGMNTSGWAVPGGTTPSTTSPFQIQTSNKWISVASRNEINVKGIQSDGSLWCWGSNGVGQYGNGNNTSSNTPLINTLQSNVMQAVSGWEHSGILKPNRSIACMTGSNYFGQLGDGTTTNRNTFDCGSVIAIALNDEMDYQNEYSNSIVLDLNENTQNDLVVYPNPTNNSITISSINADENASFKLIDCNGKVIYEINTNSIETTKMDLSYLTNGVYILISTINNETLMTRVIKQ